MLLYNIYKLEDRHNDPYLLIIVSTRASSIIHGIIGENRLSLAAVTGKH